jgi:CHAD domain-containing protein
VKAPESLASLPVARGARRAALGFLDAAHAACRRLDDAGDLEALHDFRVALRRLRSTLRAYRPWLGNGLVPPRLRKRLRKLARVTNEARDAEVMLAWLERPGRRANRAERRGLDWLRARLQQQRDAAYAHVRDRVAAQFPTLQVALRARLLKHDQTPVHRESFGAVTRELIARHAGALGHALAVIGSVEDRAAIHAARIAGKRLRYVIEPLAAEDRPLAATVRSMKSFQDRLGALCDSFVCARELVAAAGESAGSLASRRLKRELAVETERDEKPVAALAGLVRAANWVRNDIARGYSDIAGRYFGKRGGRFAASIAGAVSKLQAESRKSKAVGEKSLRR